MVKRKEYLDRLIQWREKQMIKVITGVRHCGKSTLLKLYIDYLRSNGVEDEQIVIINLEDMDYEHQLDHKSLYEYINARLCKDKYTYIFIDEVQRCSGFEKAVDSLFIKANTDIYITGSNAHMLSDEYATLLSGRYIEISMLPLSFSEYIAFTERESVNRRVFNIYMRFGSFPFMIAFYMAGLDNSNEILKTYLNGIYNTILIKDVVRCEGVTDIAVLDSVVRILCNNIGSPISTKKVSDIINSGGRSISVNTVDRYIRALTDSFIFYKIDRYDIRSRQSLKTLGKYYLVDIGLKSVLMPGSESDLRQQLENIVFLELLRRGNKVCIGKLGEMK